jgi:two-component system cell cycle sensor histidine kinase PleC
VERSRVLGFARQLRIQRSADVRVLKSQLELVAGAMEHSRVTGAVWSVALVLLTSSFLGIFGHISIWRSAFLPLGSAFFALFVMATTSGFRKDALQRPTYESMSAWQDRLIYLQFGISSLWGMSPWILWEPNNPLNHIFLAGSVVVSLANIVVSRANHAGIILAGLVPLTAIAALRFAFGDSTLDYCLAFLVPLVAAQFYSDGHRVTRRIDQDSRLRFQVEDLARELEETRDEALRKRFEAETANASKTAFLANMSHELRTPLNAILGFSEIIAQECFGPVGSARYAEYASDIHTSGAHLLSLINDLLDVAKIEAGKMEIQPHPLEAKRTFELALKLIAAKAREKRQELVIEIDPAAPPLFADERALKQILINLVSNAIKFTPESGRITVLGSLARDGDFQITVADNGPGIPREKLDKIFTPFSQVDNRYDRQAGGTGLGLALVRGLAELHGGRAWLESEAGRGCTAYVILPSTSSDESRWERTAEAVA